VGDPSQTAHQVDIERLPFSIPNHAFERNGRGKRPIDLPYQGRKPRLEGEKFEAELDDILQVRTGVDRVAAHPLDLHRDDISAGKLLRSGMTLIAGCRGLLEEGFNFFVDSVLRVRRCHER
jgi:hypothetical protein